MVYRFDLNNNRLIELDETSFPNEKVFEVAHIEEWIRKNPRLVCEKDEQIKIISKQQIYETQKRSDLIAIDNLGQIVVIEIKRDIAQLMDEFQAIRYVSSYAVCSHDEICRIYAKYLEKYQVELKISEDSDFLDEAQKEIENLCTDKKVPDDINRNQRIILVSREFSPDLLSAVTWLILKRIDIKCVALTPYKYNEELLIVPQVILPTPELSERIVRVRQAEDNLKQEKQRATWKTWEGSIEDHYSRLNTPLGDYLRQLVTELDIEPSALSGSGFHFVNSDKKVMVSTWVKSKIEFRFPKTTKEELEELLQRLGITSLTIKAKADVEPYGLEKPTPSIDFKEGSGEIKDMLAVLKSRLGIDI